MKNANHYSDIYREHYGQNISRKSIRNIIFKVILGLGVIATLFIVAVNLAEFKFAKLTEKVSSILDPNIKLIKLKEITSCIYRAEANVKAYAVSKDTSYLLSYENNINRINTRLDTLFYLSQQVKITVLNEIQSDKRFAAQMDTLSELIGQRIELFNEYVELKSEKKSADVLLQLLKKIRITKSAAEYIVEVNPQKSFLKQLFSSKKQKIELPDSIEKKILVLISTAYQKEILSESSQLSKEIYLAHREYVVMSRILFLLNNMEAKELAEVEKRILLATSETSNNIEMINTWLMIIGIFFSIILLGFIYLDVLRVRRFKAELLLANTNAEKRAAQYSLSLIEASLDPLMTINAEGRITDVNEASVNITGVSREKLKGTAFFEYFTEPEKAQEVYRNIFAKGSLVDSSLVLRNTEGKLTNVLFNGSVYTDNKGNVPGVVVVARDITKQIVFENELITAKDKAEKETKRAEEATKLIEAFLANMSHEIRTPMNAIMGFADILSQKNLPEKEKMYVNVIKTAGEKLLTIINDILDISKIEAGMMSFESVNFSIKETMKSLNVMFSERAKQKGLEINFTCDESIPAIVVGDHTRLTQIIINLVDNALKFTLEGSVRVAVKVKCRDEDRIWLDFFVSDTGIGIAEDKIGQVFDRFIQAEHHTTRMYGGTGLGLSIAKQLVTLQGGEMLLESEPDKGSTFSFTIPFQITLQKPVETKVIDITFEMEQLTKLKILLVEDSPLNVQLMTSLFSEYNLSLEVAENGRVCIDKLSENTVFDIVLMDMEMPIMNGYVATNIIRQELKSNIPIIAMTAHAMAGERDRCLNLGMNDYIPKPINSVLLFEKMYELSNKFQQS